MWWYNAALENTAPISSRSGYNAEQGTMWIIIKRDVLNLLSFLGEKKQDSFKTIQNLNCFAFISIYTILLKL